MRSRHGKIYEFINTEITGDAQGDRRRRVVICFVKENEPRFGQNPKRGGEFVQCAAQSNGLGAAGELQ